MDRRARGRTTTQILKFLIGERKLKIRAIAIKSGIVERTIYRWLVDGLVPQPAKFEKLTAFARRYGYKGAM